MFIGHYAVGFAAKKIAPKTSLGTLFAAAVWLDLLFPFYLLLDLEHFRITPNYTKLSPFEFYDYPLSHSLLMALVWAAGWGLLYLALRNNSKLSWILAGLVVSHWVLDLFVHKQDLPVFLQGGPRWGWELWNYPFWAIALEISLLIVGLEIYLLSTKALDKVGNAGLWAMVAFLVIMYLGSILSHPPANLAVIPWIGMAQWLLVAWGYWVDQHRKPV